MELLFEIFEEKFPNFAVLKTGVNNQPCSLFYWRNKSSNYINNNMAAVKEFSVEEKLTSLVHLQKIDSKLDEIQILKGELPMEVKDLEDEIEGLHARQTRVEEEINGITEFIEQKKEGIKEAQALDQKIREAK